MYQKKHHIIVHFFIYIVFFVSACTTNELKGEITPKESIQSATSTLDITISNTPSPSPNTSETPNYATHQIEQTIEVYREFDKILSSNATQTAIAFIEKVESKPTFDAGQRPNATPTPTNHINEPEIDFKVIYQDSSILVRERYLGEGFNTSNLERIDPEWPEINLVAVYPTEEECTKPFESAYWCSIPINFISKNGQPESFILDLNFSLFRLHKNGKLLGGSHINGGSCHPIPIVRKIGDEIAVEYFDAVIYVTEERGGNIYVNNSILITDGPSITDVAKSSKYSAAFAPFELQGKFIFLATLENGMDIIVFDGNEIGRSYLGIWSVECNGISRIVLGNQHAIDFIASDGDGLYHVQAGDPNYFSE